MQTMTMDDAFALLSLALPSSSQNHCSARDFDFIMLGWVVVRAPQPLGLFTDIACSIMFMNCSCCPAQVPDPPAVLRQWLRDGLDCASAAEHKAGFTHV